MKRIITLTIFIFLIFTTFSFSQDFDGGINIGFTASQVDGDGYGGFDKTGFTAGIFVNRKIVEPWTIQMEMNYSQRGSKKNINAEKNDFEFYKMHLEFVEVPLFAIYQYNERISFEGGLTGVVMIRNYEENEFSRFSSNPFYKLGISTLIGVRYKLSERVELDLRETYSLLPIRGYAENGRWWYRTGQFSNSLSFTLNYLF